MKQQNLWLFIYNKLDCVAISYHLAFQITGQWQLTSVLTNENLVQFGTLERTVINLFIILAVMIPAAQWPFKDG